VFFQSRKFTEKRTERVPEGPGDCEMCNKHFENLTMHMAEMHKVYLDFFIFKKRSGICSPVKKEHENVKI
jgi:hypothetical protein